MQKQLKFNLQPMEDITWKRNRLNIPGVGYVVKFDDVKIRRITDGMLKRIGG